MKTIDLNCDVGEGIGNEPLLFPFISSCNIACGGHFGDRDSMENTARLAMAHGVRIGAHPSYPDREYFGRRTLELPDEELRESVREQVASLLEVLNDLRAPLHHIKAHGALYNDLAGGGKLADCYLEALQPFRAQSILFVPYGSAMSGRALALGFRVWQEAFLDRAYHPDGSLVSRTQSGAVLQDPKVIFNRLKEMVVNHRVPCADGSHFYLEANTFCLHGDTPNALEILTFLKNSLPGEGIRIAV